MYHQWDHVKVSQRQTQPTECSMVILLCTLATTFDKVKVRDVQHTIVMINDPKEVPKVVLQILI